MPDYFFIPQIQFYQLIMTFPAFIGKSVVIIIIPVKIHICEPVLIWRILSVFQQILKCKETSSHMVKHSVQHYFDIVVM